ncbi:hypothetical protein RHMOL_Rhmol02G0242400 [Rhododendron molle]|uniref:Uncharacterized protein n=1 Tax=Rhododendron molle TaxID=49168 RepID=A0ACC0PT98_RHOML|nr:hypothetical protein RHMOL_Rhmol02G0242400 [Rhododendron molle]
MLCSSLKDIWQAGRPSGVFQCAERLFAAVVIAFCVPRSFLGPATYGGLGSGSLLTTAYDFVVLPFFEVDRRCGSLLSVILPLHNKFSFPLLSLVVSISHELLHLLLSLRPSIWSLIMVWWQMFWSLWLARNDLIFNNTSRSASEVGDQIKTMVAMWMKAKFDIKVYSVEDFKCFLHGFVRLLVHFVAHSVSNLPSLSLFPAMEDVHRSPFTAATWWWWFIIEPIPTRPIIQIRQRPYPAHDATRGGLLFVLPGPETVLVGRRERRRKGGWEGDRERDGDDEGEREAEGERGCCGVVAAGAAVLAVVGSVAGVRALHYGFVVIGVKEFNTVNHESDGGGGGGGGVGGLYGPTTKTTTTTTTSPPPLSRRHHRHHRHHNDHHRHSTITITITTTTATTMPPPPPPP